MELASAKAVFNKHANDKGQLPNKELQATVRDLGYRLTSSQAEEAAKKFDKDKSGTISWDEFKGWWTRYL